MAHSARLGSFGDAGFIVRSRVDSAKLAFHAIIKNRGGARRHTEA